jgi:hypothetical protein
MTTIITVATISLWLLAASRLPRIVASRSARDDIFIAAFTAALAATIAISHVYELLEDLLGIVNISTAISGALTILAFGLFRTCIVKAVVEPELQAPINRRGMKVTAAAMTAYVVSFLCAMLTGSTTSTERDPATETDIGIFIFSAIFCLFIASVGINVVLVCLKYIPSMSAKLFKAGFIMIAAGSVGGVLALVMMAIRQILVLFGGQTPVAAVFHTMYSALGSVGCAAFSAGLILPSVSGHLRALDLPSRYQLITLHPIWCRCASSNSTTVLDHGSSPLAAAFSRHPARRLHRALVEILDGHLVSRGRLLSRKDLKQVRKTEEWLYVSH